MSWTQGNFVDAGVCEAINGAQSREFQWLDRGLVNAGERMLWVLCPLIRNDYSLSPTRFNAIAAIGNYGSTTEDVLCILRERPNGRGFGRSVTIDPENGDAILWELESVEVASWFNLACRLPPGAALFGIYQYAF